jgi:hypothetical protein
MKKMLLGIIVLSGLTSYGFATPQSDCAAAAGSYLTGNVVKAPYFTHGQFKKGIELSHTHLSVKADQDGKVYDVAIDNVFANGYVKNAKSVPDPLSSIAEGDRLELCGQLYTTGVGIHWVHTNCGKTPTEKTPNGWVKKFDVAGKTSENFEAGTAYCYLWEYQKYQPRHR